MVNIRNFIISPSLIDLFAGMGGFHTALSAYGAKCHFLVQACTIHHKKSW
ncbi:hypothetical protein [Moraxella lincolnii]